MNPLFDLLLGPSPSAQPQMPAPQRAAGGTSGAGNWGGDAPLWNYLAALGTGLAAAPTGASFPTALGQGLAAGHQALRDEPERKLRRALLESQMVQSSEKAAAQQAWNAFLKTLPDAHPLRSWGPFLGPEKIADKIFARPGEGLVFDAASGGWKLDPEWLKAKRAPRP